MKVCRICLSKEGRHYPIASNSLRLLYHQLTGIVKLAEGIDKRLPQWLCEECGLRLMSYNKLRQKSLRAHHILCDLLDKVSCITEKDINEIDREKNELQSNLSYTVLDCNNVITFTYNQDTDKNAQKPKLEESDIHVEFKETAASQRDSKVFYLNEALANSVPKRLDSQNESISYIITDDIVPFSDLDDDTSNSLLSLNILKQRSKHKKDSLVEELVIKNKSLIEKTNGVAKSANKKPKSANNKETVQKATNSIKNRIKRCVKIKDVRKKVKDPFVFEDLFSVHKLSMEEKMADIEKRRDSTNYTRAPFKCSDCFKGFVSEVTFSRHRLRHTDKCGKFECKFCKKRYPDNKGFLRHMISHNATYSCKECKFVSSLRCVAVRHGLKHKGKSYTCPHCDKHFVNESSYFGHLRIKHVSHFACELCGYSFLSAKGVDIHKNLKHRREKGNVVSTDGPACPTCNFKFVSDEALNIHLRVFHLNTPAGKKRNEAGYTSAPTSTSLVCEICGIETKDGIAYRSHYRHLHPDITPTDIHTARGKPTKPAMCEMCGRLFKSKHNLLVHRKVHTRPKPYECIECELKYSSKRNLQQHVLKAHRPGETREIYPCSVCGKKLTNSGNVARHMFLHTGLRPFSCEVCSKQFKSRGDLQSHTAHVHYKKPRVRKSMRDMEYSGRPHCRKVVN